MKLLVVTRGLSPGFFIAAPAVAKPLFGFGLGSISLLHGGPPQPLGTINGLSFQGISAQAAEIEDKIVSIVFIPPTTGTSTATGGFTSIGDPFTLKTASFTCCSAATSNLGLGLCDPVPCDITVTGKDAAGGTVFQKTAQFKPTARGVFGLLQVARPEKTALSFPETKVHEIEVLSSMAIIRNMLTGGISMLTR
ncbi:hypothetical protein TWF696_000568 [Orbilia brochopaga]|uniref:Uncharacterized protein n=1 Tax=Orbilia brochopaga TaxID=3140254 RepID=A0AAV9VC19_9PEZI